MEETSSRALRLLVVNEQTSFGARLRNLLSDTSRPSADRHDEVTIAEPATAFRCDEVVDGRAATRAIQEAEARNEPYDVVFLELGDSTEGLDAVQALLRTDPHLRVVLDSDPDNPQWSNVRKHPRIGNRMWLLEQPIDPLQLRQLARTLGENARLSRENSERAFAAREAHIRLQNEIERRIRAEIDLTHDALHDPLTRMPNKALIHERIEQSLERARTHVDFRFAVLLLDLDEFAVINDSLGHEAGDRLLIEVAHRISSCTRRTDVVHHPSVPAVARLGGDEFLVLVEGVDSPEDPVAIADRLLDAIGQPIDLNGHELRPTSSVGIVLSHARYECAGSMIRDADTALHRAKTAGRARVVVFDPELRREAVARLQLECDLRHGIEAGQLFLQYQPIVDLSDLRILGFEALVRWRHPEHGVIPPVDFVPLAEETGLILPLGAWVLRSACQQTVRWRKMIPEARNLFISVNFSARQLAAEHFVASVLETLRETGLERRELHLELTESMMLPDSSETSRVIDQLSAAEIEMHLDDFGTGFSSLSYLHRLPVAAIKIDRSFLRQRDADPSVASTLDALIRMAHAQKLKVVAEGIETAAQLQLLQSLGCDQGQGFFFARPMDPEMVEIALRTVPQPVQV